MCHLQTNDGHVYGFRSLYHLMEIVLFKFRISNRAFGQTCEDDFFKANMFAFTFLFLTGFKLTAGTTV